VSSRLRRYGKTAIMPVRLKPVFWIGSSRAGLKEFPEDVQGAIGFALYVAQGGGMHEDAKPLHGFGGASVLEVIADHHGDTYRAVYTVRLTDCVYVLHSFQKKSKRGIKTSRKDLDLIKNRLKQAEKHHEEWTRQQDKKE